MKKLITVLFLFSLILGNLFCEKSKPDRGDSSSGDNTPLFKNEGYLSLGTCSCVGLLGGMFFSIADSIADSADDKNDDKPFEMFSMGLGYNLFILDFLGLGGFLNFERFGKLNLVSAQAKLSLQYGWRHFKFYHAVSGGVMFVNDGAFCPVFDVTPLGLKLDFDDFNIFVEGSVPTTAMLKAGFSWYF